MRRFKLIIIDSSPSVILFSLRKNTLPSIIIDDNPQTPDHRLTQSIVSQADSKYLIKTFLLGFFSDTKGDYFCILENYQRSSCSPLSPVSAYAHLCIEEYNLYTNFISNKESAPWERPGWLNNVLPWIDSQLQANNDYRVQFPMQIKGGWPRSVVLRIESMQRKYFFKCSYSIPPLEGHTIIEYSKHFPDHFPKIIAFNQHHNWLLMKEVPICNTIVSPKRQLELIKLYSEIQLYSAHHLDEFFPNDYFLIDAKTIMSYLNCFLQRPQTEICNRSLPVKKLKSLIAIDCDLLENSLLPYCVNNEDFQDGNILWSHDGPVFIDWANQYLSHPFFSFIYYLARYETYQQENGIDRQTLAQRIMSMKNYYLNQFASLIPTELIHNQFHAAKRLFPLIEAIRCSREQQYISPQSNWYKNSTQFIATSMQTLYRNYCSIIKQEGECAYGVR